MENWHSAHYQNFHARTILKSQLVPDFKWYDNEKRQMVSLMSSVDGLNMVFGKDLERYYSRDIRFASDFEISLFDMKVKADSPKIVEVKPAIVIPKFRDDLPITAPTPVPEETPKHKVPKEPKPQKKTKANNQSSLW